MTRIVFCKKYKQDLEGMNTPPYPGEKGQDIFNNVSKQAWEEWLEHQKMLINEGQIIIDFLQLFHWRVGIGKGQCHFIIGNSGSLR